MGRKFFHRFLLGFSWLLAFVAGALLSPQRKGIFLQQTVTDTVIYYQPLPAKSAITEVRTISIPRLLFAPADTIHTTTIVVQGDSLQMQVPIERREYRDSNYYAVISGAVVGDIHPSLEQLDIYTTREVITPKTPLFRPYLGITAGGGLFGIGGGVTIKQKIDVGGRYYRASGKDLCGVEVNYRF